MQKRIQILPGIDLSEISRYLSTSVDPAVIAWDRDARFPVEVFSELHALGIFTASLAPRFPGGGLKMIDLLGIASELAFHSPGIFSSWIGSMLAQTAIWRFGSETLAGAVCAAFAEERSIMSFCATELETGTDVINMQTVAAETEDGFRLTGGKHYITNLGFARHLVVFAKARSRSGQLEPGISAFYVPADSPGIRLGPPLQKLGQRESNTGSARFEEVFVPEANLLGALGQGYEILSSCISRTKTLISGASVGVCRRAEKEALQYLAEKRRYGEPLLKRREIQAILSEGHARMDAAWLLGCRAGAVWDETGSAVYEASVAKLFAADMAVAYVNEALELTGASGYMQESFLSKLHRDVKLFEVYEGASLVQQALIGREIFGTLLKAMRKEKAA